MKQIGKLRLLVGLGFVATLLLGPALGAVAETASRQHRGAERHMRRPRSMRSIRQHGSPRSSRSRLCLSGVKLPCSRLAWQGCSSSCRWSSAGFGSSGMMTTMKKWAKICEASRAGIGHVV